MAKKPKSTPAGIVASETPPPAKGAKPVKTNGKGGKKGGKG